MADYCNNCMRVIKGNYYKLERLSYCSKKCLAEYAVQNAEYVQKEK
jgi:hypothetical protein